MLPRFSLAALMAWTPLVLFAAAPVVTISGVNHPAQQQDTTHYETTMTSSSGLSLSQRMTRMENQVAYLMKQIQTVTTLRQNVAQLRGQLEQANHNIMLLHENQRAMSLLEQRLVQLETQQKMLPSSKHAAKRLHTGSKREQQDFQRAYQDLLKKRYSDAIKRFSSFVKRYPKSKQLANAHYWLGELYLVKGQADLASQQYRLVAADNHALHAPDAMLKLGVIFLTNGDSAHAKQMFQKVVSDYPGTAAAADAKRELKKMAKQ